MKKITKKDLLELLRSELESNIYKHYKLNGLVIYYDEYEIDDKTLDEDDFIIWFKHSGLSTVFRSYELNYVVVYNDIYKII